MPGKARFLVSAVAAALVVALVVERGTAAPSRGEDAQTHTLVGRLLVATDNIGDPRFRRTVIFMINHDSRGAMGLVVNRLIGTRPIASLLELMGSDTIVGAGDIKVHYGGPVEFGRAFVLHSADYLGNGTVGVNKDVSMTAHVGIVRAIAKGKGPRRTLFAFGYAGWGPGQLESEIAADAWISVPADDEIVFGDDVEGKWREAMAKRVIDL